MTKNPENQAARLDRGSRRFLRVFTVFGREWPLAATLLTTALFLAFGSAWLGNLSHPLWFAFLFAWLFAVILMAAFAVVRQHVDLRQRSHQRVAWRGPSLVVSGVFDAYL